MTTVFHKTNISKEKLKEIIKRNPQDLMDGLYFIDFQLATDKHGVIDFLGADEAGRLVLVNFNVDLGDGMFIPALAQMHWLKKNNGLIKRLFFSENIEFSLEPKMLLVSGGFSGELIYAAKQIKPQDIRLVEFRYITAQGKDAIVFEEVFTSRNPYLADTPPAARENISLQGESISKEQLPAKSLAKRGQEQIKTSRLILEDVSLSEEEIAEFMEFEKTLAEKKLAA